MIRDVVAFWFWYGLFWTAHRSGLNGWMLWRGPRWLWAWWTEQVVARAWGAEERIGMREAGLWP